MHVKIAKIVGKNQICVEIVWIDIDKTIQEPNEYYHFYETNESVSQCM